MSVASNVAASFERKKAALFAFSDRLAEECVQEAQRRQLFGEEFWNNETKTAVRTLFAKAFMEKDAIGFFIAHHIEYGIYLELANDRQNAILLPMITEYAPRLLKFAQELYGSAA